MVGFSYTVSGDRHAFLFNSATGMLDLNSLIGPTSGWMLNIAYGINNRGQITGSGTINGESHAFLLTPVPEPSSLALATIAMALAGFLGNKADRIGISRRNC